MEAVQQVIVISILIGIGYFLAKRGIFTPKTGKELSWLLINIVTPALILKSFQIDSTPEKLRSLLFTFALAFFSYGLVIVLSYLYCGRGEENKVDRLALTFSNTGFMGLPLVEGIYGSEGLFYASIMVIVFNFMFWTYGAAAIRGKFTKESARKILLSPTILSVVLGLVLFLGHVSLPLPLRSTLGHLSNLNTPIAMLVAGVSISQSDLGAVFRNTRLYKMLLGKLVLAPVVVALVFSLLPGAALIKEVLVVQIACPVAAIIGITMLQYGGDDKLATEYFTLTTLASMVSIPLVRSLCGLILR